MKTCTRLGVEIVRVHYTDTEGTTHRIATDAKEPDGGDCGQRQSPARRAEVHSAFTAQSIGEAAQSRARRDHTRGICDRKLRFAWRAHSSIGGGDHTRS